MELKGRNAMIKGEIAVIEDTVRRKSSLSLGLQFAPAFCYRYLSPATNMSPVNRAKYDIEKISRRLTVGYSAGIYGSYRFSDHLALGLGFNYQLIKFQSKVIDSFFYINNYQLITTTYSYDFFNLPCWIEYLTKKTSKKYFFSITAGTELGILSAAKFEIQNRETKLLKYQYVFSSNGEPTPSGETTYKRWPYISCNVGFGVCYQLNKKVFISLNPRISSMLTSVPSSWKTNPIIFGADARLGLIL